MPERSTLKPPPTSSVPSLVPQGEQTGKPAMPLGRPFTLIGSRNRAHLHLLSSTISRNHACIISTDTGLYLRDLASRTGVLVNGRKVKDADLNDGDKVQIGSFKFRFTDPASSTRLGITPKPVAAMLEIDGTTLTPVDGRTILIGRRPICDIALPEAGVSNTHALIFDINGQRFIRDLGSRTGTLVNGKPIHHQELEFGDQIQIGDTEFRYVSAVAPLEQPVDLEPEELAHAEDDEPIGLDFDEREPSHVAEIDSIPEAEEHELLAPEPVDEPEQQPLELARVDPEPTEEPAAVDSSELAEPDAHHDAIDFEIAGSQLDLQKKLMETLRLAAQPEEPPAHAVTASPELLQPVEDHGLAWHNHKTAEGSGQVTAAPAEPTEHMVESEPPAAPAPESEFTTTQRDSAFYDMHDEPAEGHLTSSPELIADLEQEAAALVEEPIAPAESAEPQLAPFLDPESESSSRSEEPAPPAEREAVTIEQMDLSAVDFGAEPGASPGEAATVGVEEPPESPSEPKPLLNLDAELPPAPEVATMSATSAVLDELADRLAEKPKTRRKRGRKKKGDAAPSQSQAPAPAVSMEPDAGRDVAVPDGGARLVASESDVAEVIEPTKPTPDSAQDLGEALEATEPPLAPVSQVTAAEDGLTDTAFAQVVQEFTGPELGPIVEEPVAPDAQATVPDEGVTAAPSAAIPEPEPMVAPSQFTIDSSAFIEEPAIEPAIPPDPSLDEVIELDSSALLDDVEDTAARDEPEPLGFTGEIADVANPSVDSATVDDRSEQQEFAAEDNPPRIPQEPASDEASAAPRKPIDPFFGLERDLGSFIGGVPLRLSVDGKPEEVAASQAPRHSEPPPIPPSHATTPLDEEFPSLPGEQAEAPPPEPMSPPASAAASDSLEASLSAHVAPPAADDPAGIDDLPDLDALDVEEKLTFSEESELLPSLDTLLADDQEPLELFEGAAEKLDGMPEGLEPIEDVGGALAEAKEPAAPPMSPPTAPPIKRGESPFAAAPVAGAPAKHKVTPPPPPKTSPLRSFTHTPFDVSPADASPSNAGVSPFAGGQPPHRGRVTSFEGLAMPPVRETDVFSHEAFSGLDDVFFGAPPGDVPPIPPTKRQPGSAPPPGSSETAGAPLHSTEPPLPDAAPGTSAKKQRDRKREAIPPNRQALRGGQPGSAKPPAPPPARPLAQPAASAAEPGQRKRVPWWKRVRTLLPLMFVCLVGAWAAVYFALPPRHVIEGAMRFQGLENLDTFQRKERADGIRKLLRQPELRLAAAESARNAGAPGGFPDDPAILEQLSEPSSQPNLSHSEFDDNRKTLFFFHPTREPDLDRIRMKAVLAQLYAEDGSQRDRAATAKSGLDAHQNRVNELEQQRAAEELLLKRLSDDVTATGGTSAADVLDGKVSVQTLDQQDQQFRAAWQKASRDLTQRQGDLEKAQTAPPATAAAQAEPQPDPPLTRLKASLDSLNNQLQAAGNPDGGSAGQAAQAFDAAFGRLDEQLAAVTAPPDNVALAAYLEAARAARDEIRQILQRTRSDAQALQQLRGRLSEQPADAAPADGALHDLLEERNAYAHRYEAAAGSGLAEEALKIRGVLDDLDQKIDARRQALKAGGTAAPQPAQDSIAQLERDRQRDPLRMQERLKRVQQAAPPPQAVPAKLKEAVAELGRRVSAALAAADRYAAAVATPDTDAGRAVAAIQTKIAEVQAQIEGRRKSLAAAAAAELDQQQRQQRQAALAAAQKAVTTAMEAESGAATAYTNNRKLLSAARDLAEEKGRAAELMQKLQVAREELDQQKKSAALTAVVLAPDDNSVSITYAQDRRVTYLVLVSLVIVLFFGILMWSASSQSAQAEVPFANAVAIAHDVPGHHPEDFRSEMTEDDPHQAMMA